MELTQRDADASLMEGNSEYRQLREEHRQCEERLQALYTKTFLNEDESLESTRLKRRKLYLKDRMEAMARSSGG